MKKIKFTLFLIATFVLEIMSFLISASFQNIKTVTDKGGKASVDIAIDGVSKFLLNPIKVTNLMIESKNPLFVMLVIGSVILAIYFVYGVKTKSYQVETKYAVHGSSRFAHVKEIVRGNDIITVKVEDMLFLLENNMSGGEDNEEKKEI